MTVFKDRLEGVQYILYWCICMAFTGLALLTAALDMIVVRLREFRSEKRIIREVFKDVEEVDIQKDDEKLDQFLDRLEQEVVVERNKEKKDARHGGDDTPRQK